MYIYICKGDRAGALGRAAQQTRAAPQLTSSCPGREQGPLTLEEGEIKTFIYYRSPQGMIGFGGGGGGREGRREAVLLNASFGKGKQRILGLSGGIRGVRHWGAADRPTHHTSDLWRSRIQGGKGGRASPRALNTLNSPGLAAVEGA